MSIRPIDFNGMVQRTQDVSTMKQSADNKPVVDQQFLTVQHQKTNTQQLRQVQEQEDAQENQKKYDAREKGSNSYERQQKKQKKKQAEGQAVKKAPARGFDMKI
ncbi:MAG: hypothetical protein HFI41_10570 [Lachnospiraceae bacterium]|nr:hypothetical protein [Lachnospiraceae bacterium]